MLKMTLQTDAHVDWEFADTGSKDHHLCEQTFSCNYLSSLTSQFNARNQEKQGFKNLFLNRGRSMCCQLDVDVFLARYVLRHNQGFPVVYFPQFGV